MSEPTLQDIADKVDDVARLLVRQSATLSGLLDSRHGEAGPDTALLVELHTLYADALRCAATARYGRERDAFRALGGGLERLIAGRGGSVVLPAVGDPFDATTMSAVAVLDTSDPAADRTVARLVEPGLQVGSRSVRAAQVCVHRHRPPGTASAADQVGGPLPDPSDDDGGTGRGQEQQPRGVGDA